MEIIRQNEYYIRELIDSDETRMPKMVRSPKDSILYSFLAPLVGQELPVRLANHGKPRTEDLEEWAIILSEGKTIMDKAMLYVWLEEALMTFILSSITETPFIFWIGLQLVILVLIDGLIGFKIRFLFHKKLPITLIFFLFLLTQVISPKDNESTIPQHLGLMLCRFFGSAYPFWMY